MLRFLLFLTTTLVAQEVKPATPARIHVGCEVQAAYFGPAQQWFVSVNSLSDEQIANLESVVAANPDDICARGYLIAHGQDRVPRRIEHVLWMIGNHPEWDGFLLNMSIRNLKSDQAAYDRIRAVWLQQARPEQQSATVLHHAAVFFGLVEPDYAVELLERAIRLEPKVAFHVEGLGILYGHALLQPQNPSFAARTKSALLASTDWVMIAGALHATGKALYGETRKQLSARLMELTGDRAETDLLKDLPSRSEPYLHYRCTPVPLLRRCVDQRIP
jgi:hypothetical protein